MMNTNICKLCQTALADKTNSHVIPKFLLKDLFENVSPRHALIIEKTKDQRIIQDTPKESFILCSNCEHRVEIVETHFSNFFVHLNNYNNNPNKFSLYQLGIQQFIECNNLNPTLFKLFIYSLVWRASISKLSEFQQFYLLHDAEEKLRNFLNNNLKNTHKELFESLKHIGEIPLYHSCLIKSKQKARGIFSVCNMNETSHILLLVNQALFFIRTTIQLMMF